MLTKVKKALRISNTTFDDEIQDLIDGALSDLQLSGVVNVVETDSLIIRAVVTYCKANFGWDNPDSEKLQMSYEMLKQHLTLSGEYGAYIVTFTVTDGSVNLEDAKVTFGSKEKDTDISGIATFKGIDEKQNITYKVTLTGYQDKEGTLDVTQNEAITVTLVVV